MHTNIHIKRLISIYFFRGMGRGSVAYTHYRTRTTFQNYNNLSQISIAKRVNTSFMNITFCCCFFFFCRSGLKRRTEKNLIKNKLMPKFKWQWIMHHFENLKWKKCCRDCCNRLQRQTKNYNYLHLNVFYFLFAIWIIFCYFFLMLKYLFISK